MLKFEKDNEKIGRYLDSLIKDKGFKSVRAFCIAYLKLDNQDTSDDLVANMQNRMSQIIKGKKAVQLHDLPLFCELLGVSCEEILSVGKHYEPISGHVTNYEIAFSHDKDKWDKYINRKDMLILNSDEYNKTVIDYALEFKNYDFLKYLMDNKYIWFVKDKLPDRSFTFGAGTSIKRKDIGMCDILDSTLNIYSEERGLRQRMILLALENNDFEMLDSLLAREIPTLYQWCYSGIPISGSSTSCQEYFDENVVEEIVNSSDRVLGYFSEEFKITDRYGAEHQVIYPFLSEVLNRLIRNRNKYAEVLLRRATEHNRYVLNSLKTMITEAIEIKNRFFNLDDTERVPIEKIILDAIEYFTLNNDKDLVSCQIYFVKSPSMNFSSNIIKVDTESNDLLISGLIKELNSVYNSICNIKSDMLNTKEA